MRTYEDKSGQTGTYGDSVFRDRFTFGSSTAVKASAQRSPALRNLNKTQMAIISSETDLGGVLGDRVTLEKVRNKALVTYRPKRKPGPATPKQEEVRDRFLEAAQYAKHQTMDPEGKAFYQKGVSSKMKSAYTVALTDYLSTPTVKSITTKEYQGKAGDLITVWAKDDFVVTRVSVMIKDRKGNLLEQGDAEPDTINPHIWTYTAKTANPSLAGSTIQAIAFDRPGNEGVMEVTV